MKTVFHSKVLVGKRDVAYFIISNEQTQSKQVCYFLFLTCFVFEPAHDKTYNKTRVTSKDSGQPVHLPSMARVLVHPCLNSWRL